MLSGTVELADPHVSIQGEAIAMPVDRTDMRISAPLDRSGFQLKNVYPGRYWVFGTWGFVGADFDSVKLGERDITIIGEEIELVEGGPALRVIFKSGGGLVRGTIEHGDRAGVALIPQDGRPVLWPSSCCEGGRFEFANVRPGDYYCALPSRRHRRAVDPAVSRNLIAHAASVHVESGGTAWMDLKITPVR